MGTKMYYDKLLFIGWAHFPMKFTGWFAQKCLQHIWRIFTNGNTTVQLYLMVLGTNNNNNNNNDNNNNNNNNTISHVCECV